MTRMLKNLKKISYELKVYLEFRTTKINVKFAPHVEAPQDQEPLYIYNREGTNGEGPTTGSGQHDAGKSDGVPVAGEKLRSRGANVKKIDKSWQKF